MAEALNAGDLGRLAAQEEWRLYEAAREEWIRAQEEGRRVSNANSIREAAKRCLGHVYDTDTRELLGQAYAGELPDSSIALGETRTEYQAIVHRDRQEVLQKLKIAFNLNIPVLAPVLPEASARYKKTAGKVSDCFFCAVLCLKIDKCRATEFPPRIPPQSASLNQRIVRSADIYAGYRIVLKLSFFKEESTKKTGAFVGVTVANFLKLGFGGECKELSERTISEVTIEECTGFGDYRPSLGLGTCDPSRILEALNEIKREFDDRCFSVRGRHISIRNPEDVEPLRELPPLHPRREEVVRVTALQQPSICLASLERDEQFFIALAEAIIGRLDENTQRTLASTLRIDWWKRISQVERRLESSQLSLARMLFAMDKAFTSSYAHMLSNSSDSAYRTLILGRERVGKSIVGACLMGGRLVSGCVRLPGELVKDVLDYDEPPGASGHAFPSIRHLPEGLMPMGVSVYGNFIETSILPGDLAPLEDQICYGTANAIAMMRYKPQSILVVLNLEDLQGENCAQKIHEHLKTCYRYFLDNNRVQFIVNLPGKGPYVDSPKKVVELAIQEKQHILQETISPSVFARLKALLSFSQDERDNILFSAYSEREAFEYITKWITDIGSVSGVREGSEQTQQAASESGSVRRLDLSNLCVNEFGKFRLSLDMALEYFQHLERSIEVLREELDNNTTLLRAVAHILEVFDTRRVHELSQEILDQVQVEIAPEIRQFSERLETMQASCTRNREEIDALDLEIETLENDPTPMGLPIHPNQRIEPRKWWEIFGTTYTFDASAYRVFSYSMNETEVKGTFSREGSIFRFTPKHYGHPQDMQARVSIRVRRKDHPDTQEDIRRKRTEKTELETTNSELNRKIRRIEGTLEELRRCELPKLQNRRKEIEEVQASKNNNYNKFQAQLEQHRSFYEMLQYISRSDEVRNLRNL